MAETRGMLFEFCRDEEGVVHGRASFRVDDLDAELCLAINGDGRIRAGNWPAGARPLLLDDVPRALVSVLTDQAEATRALYDD